MPMIITRLTAVVRGVSNMVGPMGSFLDSREDGEFFQLSLSPQDFEAFP